MTRWSVQEHKDSILDNYEWQEILFPFFGGHDGFSQEKPFRLAFRFVGQGEVELGLDDIKFHVEYECCHDNNPGSGGGDNGGGSGGDADDPAKKDNNDDDDDDIDDSGSGCGITPGQSSTILFVLMLAIGLFAMATGLRKGRKG
jgi:hypothetical protein